MIVTTAPRFKIAYGKFAIGACEATAQKLAALFMKHEAGASADLQAAGPA
jgi:hypothetical protein